MVERKVFLIRSTRNYQDIKMKKITDTSLETQTPVRKNKELFDFITTAKFAEIVFFLESRIFSDSSSLKSIYHYTTIEALFDGIIPKNASEEIIFRATNSNYMNDPEELKIDIENFYEDVKHIKYFSLLSERNYFDNIVDKIDNAYLLSFSENKDFLPMWNMYAQNGNGVVLEFEKKLVTLSETPLIRCVYPRRDTYKVIINFLERIFADGNKQKYARGRFFLELDKIKYKSSNCDVKESLQQKKERKSRVSKVCNFDDCDNCCENLEALLFLSIFPIIAYKHNAYDYEKELRLIVFEKDTSKIQFRKKDGMLIPYIELKIKRTALKSVIVGLTQDFERTQKSLRMFLDSRGLNYVNIVKSSVPYRN